MGRPFTNTPEFVYEREFSEMRIDTERGCWLADDGGRRYRRVNVNGKETGLHRLVAHLFHGLDLDDPQQFACHSCDVPQCFNPEHVYAGNVITNNRDTARRSRLNTCSRRRFSTEQVRDIRSLYQAGISQREIASRYSVTKNAIANIIHLRVYGEV